MQVVEQTRAQTAPAYGNDDERWAAVVQRDPAADGHFYYSVRTTGVYCRPSCGGRLARRENVRFHASCQDAETAGFRPCKRCKPTAAPAAARRMIARGADLPTPATVIRFAVGECSLGAILVAASDRGVCAILLGDDPGALVRDLQDRFPKTALQGGDADFERWVAEVVAFVEAPALGLDLPLDMRGTAFQHRVWRALLDIPAGSTATYTQIAQRLGLPKAVRAVAQACAANKLAVAIPCHRVVRNDGTLSGYRWGLERKRALLEREAVA